MDLSEVIAADAAEYKSTEVTKAIPLNFNLTYLLCGDSNVVSADDLAASKEAYIRSITRDGVQALLSNLLKQTISRTDDGPAAVVPTESALYFAKTTQGAALTDAIDNIFILPRAKSLPKKKPETKWEKFARMKGIQHSKKDRRVFDEQTQTWVNRWGKEGLNQREEKAWLTELPSNVSEGAPTTLAKSERKSRKVQNEKQRLHNEEQAAKAAENRKSKTERNQEIRQTLLRTKGATASMGKFDKELKDDPKVKGVKRKYKPTEVAGSGERSDQAAIFDNLKSHSAIKKKRTDGVNDTKAEVSTRKAVRTFTKRK